MPNYMEYQQSISNELISFKIEFEILLMVAIGAKMEDIRKLFYLKC